MECCLASSREKMITLAGIPNSPESSRRVSTCPKEPVPPVMRIRFPSSRTVVPPFVIRCTVRCQLFDQPRPRGRYEARGSLETNRDQASITMDLGRRLDFDWHLI